MQNKQVPEERKKKTGEMCKEKINIIKDEDGKSIVITFRKCYE